MTAAVTDHGGGDGPPRGMAISWGGKFAIPNGPKVECAVIEPELWPETN